MTKIIRLNSFDAIAAEHKRPAAFPWYEEISKGGVISIGNFDGVHLGHVSLLNRVRKLADASSVAAIAVSFDPHPAAILRPEHAPQRLMTIDRRAEVMSRYGIDQLIVCPVSSSFLDLSARQFFSSLVVDCLQATSMVEGPNFFFGRGREGGPSTLASLCEQNQLDLEIVEPSLMEDSMISSSRIRTLLTNGDVKQAQDILSDPYQIKGTVIKGDRRGREIGFPTANLNDIEVLVPGSGVYGGTATIDGRSFPAAIHVGPNPTFSEQQKKIEVHVLKFNGDLYGSELKVDFYFRLRDVSRFASADLLVTQLRKDVATVSKYFN